MADRYFTDKDISKMKKSYYRFYKDVKTGGLRGFNGLDEELTLEEVIELIEGLTKSYLDIGYEDYKVRMYEQIKLDVENDFNQFNEGPPIEKFFRRDIKKHYTVVCSNCLKKISTKKDQSYWFSQSTHEEISGKKFCSEWCANKYIDELRQMTIKELKVHYGI